MMDQRLYINRRKHDRRMRELEENPLPPYVNYLRAQVFLERLHRQRKNVSKGAYAEMRKQAINGDISGAEWRLHREIYEVDASMTRGQIIAGLEDAAGEG